MWTGVLTEEELFRCSITCNSDDESEKEEVRPSSMALAPAPPEPLSLEDEPGIFYSFYLTDFSEERIKHARKQCSLCVRYHSCSNCKWTCICGERFTSQKIFVQHLKYVLENKF